jgi:hypothetical protein
MIITVGARASLPAKSVQHAQPWFALCAQAGKAARAPPGSASILQQPLAEYFLSGHARVASETRQHQAQRCAY